MYWYIKLIIIYGLNGETRSIPLEPGVNIITGRSQTGKSALIPIVDYCLGSGNREIPSGIIREFAQWYAIVVQTQEEQIFLARKEPKERNTSGIMHMKIAYEVSIPSLEELQKGTTDRKNVIDELSRRLGMMDFSLAESHYDTSFTEPPTIRNVVPFLFQPQNVIANKDILFYKTDQEKHNEQRQRLQRIFPYVLGAITAEYFKLKNDLDYAQRIHRQADRLLREQSSLASEGASVARSLLDQTIALGIATDPPDHQADLINIRRYLASLLEAQRHEARLEPVVIDHTDLITTLQQRSRNLRSEIGSLRRQLASAEELTQETSQFATTLAHQAGRLKVIGLFDDIEEKQLRCPLCNQTIENHLPSIRRLQEVNNEVRKQLENVTAANPVLNKHISEIRDNIYQKRQELLVVESEISELYKIQGNTISENADSIWIEQQRLLGAIQFYLNRVPEISQSLSELERREKEARRKVSQLETSLQDLNVDEILPAALDIIAQTMTNLSKRLRLEKPDAALRLDIKKLTVIRISSTGKPERLHEIGSGENWVGYHLCALFALHDFFNRINSPVPSFLFIDQPSQIYFPEEKKNTTAGQPGERRTDWESVRIMYNMIFDTANEFQNRIQVIILDHAKLEDSRFEGAIKKNWLEEGALI